MHVKIEARILIFPGTDFHLPSTSVPPGTFFRLCALQVEKFGPDRTEPSTTHNGAYSLAVTYFYTQNLSRTFSQPSINLFMFFTKRALNALT